MFNVAKYYDRIYRDKPYREEVETILPYLKKGSLIDIGGGTGGHAINLRKNGFKVLVADVSPEMLAIAHNKGLETKLINIESDTPIERFENAIMLFHVFNFLKNQEKALKNIYNLLHKGGRLVFDYWDNSIKKSGWALRQDGIVSRITHKRWNGNTATIRFWFPFLFAYEQHTLYCPSKEVIKRMLQENRFKIITLKRREADEIIIAEKT